MNPLQRKFRDIPLVCGFLTIVNIIVFMICTFTGELLYNMGGVDRWSILVHREYGRLFWAMFLHVDVQHLFNNMIVLFFLGGMLEKEFGHIRTLIVYILSGLGGNAVSLAGKVFHQSNALSVGASGAVFGMDGLLLAMVLFYPEYRQKMSVNRVGIMIILSLYSGFMTSNVDNAAHVGGLIVGFLVGSILCVAEQFRRKKNRVRCRGEY